MKAMGKTMSLAEVSKLWAKQALYLQFKDYRQSNLSVAISKLQMQQPAVCSLKMVCKAAAPFAVSMNHYKNMLQL